MISIIDRLLDRFGGGLLRVIDGCLDWVFRLFYPAPKFEDCALSALGFELHGHINLFVRKIQWFLFITNDPNHLLRRYHIWFERVVNDDIRLKLERTERHA